MRNLKRALSLALALVMVLSMMVVGASAVSADDFSDSADIVNKEAVSVLATLGVITGNDDGSYAPADTISRAEMATIICRVLNGGSDPVLGETVTNTYTDTASHWAKNYIEYCSTLGIIAGKGDGTFDPEGDVTVSEAAKMVLVALGYNAGLEGYTGGAWQINVDARANPLGLYDDLSYTNTSAALTRDNAAQMLYNALDCYMVNYSVITNATTSSIISNTQLNVTNVTLLEDRFDAVKVEGVVIANEMANLNGTGHLNDNRTRIQVTNDEYQSAYSGPTDFAITTGLDELGRAVSIYVKIEPNSVNAQVLGSVILSEDNVVVTDYTDDSIADVADDNNLDASGAYVAVNYGSASSYDTWDGVQGVEKILIDNDNDTEVDYVLLNHYHFGKVTSYVTSGNGSIAIDLGRDTDSLSRDNSADVVGFDDVARDDYVIAAVIGNRIHVSLAETLVGVMEAYKEDGGDIVTLTVDGTDYSTSTLNGFTGGTDDIKAAKEYSETYLNNEATFYLGAGGYIVAVGETDESAYRYALVLATGTTGLEDRVRVALSDGTTAAYDVSSNSDLDADEVRVGTVYRYSINGSGQIRLSAAYNEKAGDAAKFLQGRTTISATDAANVDFSRHATANTAFFYVGLTALEWEDATNGSAGVDYDGDGTIEDDESRLNSIDADFVNVYTGYNNAPDLDDNINYIQTVVYTRDNDPASTNAGAVVFYGDADLISADVDQSLYISSVGTRNDDYINVTAFIAGEEEAQSIRVDGSNDVTARGAYTWTINADGYYDLEPIGNEPVDYWLGGSDDGSNGNDERVRVTNDTSDTFVAGGREFVITDETLLVDHSKYLTAPIGRLGDGPYTNDLIQWVVCNGDSEAILVVVRNDEINDNTDHGDGTDEVTNGDATLRVVGDSATALSIDILYNSDIIRYSFEVTPPAARAAGDILVDYSWTIRVNDRLVRSGSETDVVATLDGTDYIVIDEADVAVNEGDEVLVTVTVTDVTRDDGVVVDPGYEISENGRLTLDVNAAGVRQDYFAEGTAMTMDVVIIANDVEMETVEDVQFQPGADTARIMGTKTYEQGDVITYRTANVVPAEVKIEYEVVLEDGTLAADPADYISGYPAKISTQEAQTVSFTIASNDPSAILTLEVSGAAEIEGREVDSKTWTNLDTDGASTFNAKGSATSALTVRITGLDSLRQQYTITDGVKDVTLGSVNSNIPDSLKEATLSLTLSRTSAPAGDQVSITVAPAGLEELTSSDVAGVKVTLSTGNVLVYKNDASGSVDTSDATVLWDVEEDLTVTIESVETIMPQVTRVVATDTNGDGEITGGNSGDTITVYFDSEISSVAGEITGTPNFVLNGQLSADKMSVVYTVKTGNNSTVTFDIDDIVDVDGITNVNGYRVTVPRTFPSEGILDFVAITTP